MNNIIFRFLHSLVTGESNGFAVWKRFRATCEDTQEGYLEYALIQYIQGGEEARDNAIVLAYECSNKKKVAHE